MRAVYDSGLYVSSPITGARGTPDVMQICFQIKSRAAVEHLKHRLAHISKQIKNAILAWKKCHNGSLVCQLNTQQLTDKSPQLYIQENINLLRN